MTAGLKKKWGISLLLLSTLTFAGCSETEEVASAKEVSPSSADVLESKISEPLIDKEGINEGVLKTVVENLFNAPDMEHLEMQEERMNEIVSESDVEHADAEVKSPISQALDDYERAKYEQFFTPEGYEYFIRNLPFYAMFREDIMSIRPVNIQSVENGDSSAYKTTFDVEVLNHQGEVIKSFPYLILSGFEEGEGEISHINPTDDNGLYDYLYGDEPMDENTEMPEKR